MSKIKQALAEPNIDQRLVDERGPTAERVRGAEFDVGDSGVITFRQSPIERGMKRGTFTERQWVASEKLYAHWIRAGLAGSVGSSDPLKIFATTMDFSRLFASEVAEANARAVRNAFRAVWQGVDAGGQRADHACVVLRLMVFDELPLCDAGQAIGFLGKKAEIMALTLVRSALNILIKEWGL